MTFLAQMLSMYLTRDILNFCPFAVKVRCTALIFIECITFLQTNILDDMHKVLAVFNGHK